MATRIKGDWITLQVDKSADVAQMVQDTFAQNTYAHSIVFRAKKDLYNLYDKIKLKIDNKIFTSYIATIVEQKDSNLAEYTCGELQVQYPFLNLL